jgi:uncharacterized membrane protein YdbT with pleckstrin-like domain
MAALMSYVQRILQPGETLRAVGRIHWIVYVPGLALFALAVVGYVALADENAHGGLNPLLLGVVGIVMIASLLSLFFALLRRWSTEIAVTNRRVILKRGIVARHSIEMNMDKVESVDVDQSILGRLFDYGDVTVRGTGAGLEPVRAVARPLDFRNQVTAG